MTQQAAMAVYCATIPGPQRKRLQVHTLFLSFGLIDRRSAVRGLSFSVLIKDCIDVLVTCGFVSN